MFQSQGSFSSSLFPCSSRQRWFLLLSALLVSATVFEIWWMYLYDPIHLPQDDWNQGALVHYTDINQFPTVQLLSEPTRLEERAFVTALFSDTYAYGVAVLGHSLERSHMDARRIVMYIPGQVSDATLCLVRTQGWETIPVERIPPPRNGHRIHHTFIDQYTKIQLWGFDQFGIKSLVYVDGDTLLLRPFPNDIFDLPFTFAAVPDGIDTPLVNGGVLFIKPNSMIRDDMLNKIETAEFNLEWAEQNFFNLYFGGQVLRLPWLFNANVWIKKSSPKLWEGMWDEIYLIHFTSAKPFPAYKGGLRTIEEMESAIDSKARSQPYWKDELELWKKEWILTRDEKREDMSRCIPSRK
ncbi:glycosyltransferase family 8 protein [Flagelloscypha sp. PMI_526]|nr:glycosyltransferase family 8 protein [Flagelloscypha sp. PMI_526]